MTGEAKHRCSMVDFLANMKVVFSNTCGYRSEMLGVGVLKPLVISEQAADKSGQECVSSRC